jgi:carotenoid cleavage dioxygenase-like enzyme
MALPTAAAPRAHRPTSPPPPARQSLEARPPFAHDTDAFVERDVSLRGRLPDWLRGDLLRTCPAVFERGAWEARHWFDGLCLLYAFRLGDDGAVRFRSRLLDTETARDAAAGRVPRATFATPIRRSFLSRLFHPIAPVTDNANVNVLEIGDDVVALTEGPHQPIVDQRALAVRGLVEYDDDLPDGAIMSAHPHFDFARRLVVNTVEHLGVSSFVGVYEHPPGERRRRLIGRWATKRVPYVHSFGLTPSSAIVIAHPLTTNPLTMLWSNRGFIDHFDWRPRDPTRLVVFDRATGAVTEHETDPLFVFHTVNAYDAADELVLDLCAYPDASLIDRLRTDQLAARLPELTGELVRLRIPRAGRGPVRRERLADVGFEFPSISYKRVSARPHSVLWGASGGYERDGGGGYRARVVRIDVGSGRVSSFAADGWLFGEPIFVARPDGSAEDDGVLLTIAHGLDRRATALAVLDARTLAEVAWAELDAAVPLGFHGSFMR